jgi:hypothetical protein
MVRLFAARYCEFSSSSPAYYLTQLEPTLPTMTSQEAQAIADIRDNMEPMRELATKNKRYLEEQAQELAKKGKSALFDILEEKRQQFHAEYASLRSAVIMQISEQVNYMEDRKSQYAAEWDNLLAELRHYLSGISALGFSL